MVRFWKYEKHSTFDDAKHTDWYLFSQKWEGGLTSITNVMMMMMMIQWGDIGRNAAR